MVSKPDSSEAYKGEVEGVPVGHIPETQEYWDWLETSLYETSLYETPLYETSLYETHLYNETSLYTLLTSTWRLVNSLRCTPRRELNISYM